jgi:hypothetical protein
VAAGAARLVQALALRHKLSIGDIGLSGARPARAGAGAHQEDRKRQ